MNQRSVCHPVGGGGGGGGGGHDNIVIVALSHILTHIQTYKHKHVAFKAHHPTSPTHCRRPSATGHSDNLQTPVESPTQNSSQMVHIAQ